MWSCFCTTASESLSQCANHCTEWSFTGGGTTGNMWLTMSSNLLHSKSAQTIQLLMPGIQILCTYWWAKDSSNWALDILKNKITYGRKLTLKNLWSCSNLYGFCVVIIRCPQTSYTSSSKAMSSWTYVKPTVSSINDHPWCPTGDVVKKRTFGLRCRCPGGHTILSWHILGDNWCWSMWGVRTILRMSMIVSSKGPLSFLHSR